MQKSITLKLPEVGFIASSRVALGAGLGLVLADKLNSDQRRGAGWMLLAVGAVTTVPVVLKLIRKTRRDLTPGIWM